MRTREEIVRELNEAVRESREIKASLESAHQQLYERNRRMKPLRYHNMVKRLEVLRARMTELHAELTAIPKAKRQRYGLNPLFEQAVIEVVKGRVDPVDFANITTIAHQRWEQAHPADVPDARQVALRAALAKMQQESREVHAALADLNQQREANAAGMNWGRYWALIKRQEVLRASIREVKDQITTPVKSEHWKRNPAFQRLIVEVAREYLPAPDFDAILMQARTNWNSEQTNE